MIKHPDEATAAGFDVADIEAGAQRLWVDTATVRAYVDQMLAHSDQRHPAELPTLKHVHDAIDLILDTFQRTYAKLTGQFWAIDLMAIDYDWQEVLTVPWLVRPKDPWERSAPDA